MDNSCHGTENGVAGSYRGPCGDEVDDDDDDGGDDDNSGSVLMVTLVMMMAGGDEGSGNRAIGAKLFILPLYYKFMKLQDDCTEKIAHLGDKT